MVDIEKTEADGEFIDEDEKEISGELQEIDEANASFFIELRAIVDLLQGLNNGGKTHYLKYEEYKKLRNSWLPNKKLRRGSIRKLQTYDWQR